jgi:hypothetical protein
LQLSLITPFEIGVRFVPYSCEFNFLRVALGPDVVRSVVRKTAVRHNFQRGGTAHSHRHTRALRRHAAHPHWLRGAAQCPRGMARLYRAAEALAWTKAVMTKLGLTLNEAKTSLRNARQERFEPPPRSTLAFIRLQVRVIIVCKFLDTDEETVRCSFAGSNQFVAGVLHVN